MGDDNAVCGIYGLDGIHNAVVQPRRVVACGGQCQGVRAGCTSIWVRPVNSRRPRLAPETRARVLAYITNMAQSFYDVDSTAPPDRIVAESNGSRCTIISFGLGRLVKILEGFGARLLALLEAYSEVVVDVSVCLAVWRLGTSRSSEHFRSG